MACPQCGNKIDQIEVDGAADGSSTDGCPHCKIFYTVDVYSWEDLVHAEVIDKSEHREFMTDQEKADEEFDEE